MRTNRMLKGAALILTVLMVVFASGRALAAENTNTQANGPADKTASGEPIPPTYQATTDWGMTTPDTRITWTYQDQPVRSFTGEPEYMLIGFSFPKRSAALNQEARGSSVDATRDLTAGGDAPDLSDVRLLVVGFADGLGERSMGERLGLRRAEVARNLLVKMGYRRENIQVTSFGSRYATANTWEPDKQKAERQVQVWVLGERR